MDIITTTDNNDELLIEINIIDSCNLNCFYCSNLINGYQRKNTHLDLEQTYQLIDYLEKTYRRPIRIIILGGEPTLHPNLYEFCKRLSNNYIIEIFTNLQKPIDYYLAYNLLKNTLFRISYHNFNNNISSFKQKVLFLTKNNIKIKPLYIMLNPKTFDSSIQLYNEIKTEIPCELVKIQDFSNSNSINYSKTQLEQINQYSSTSTDNYVYMNGLKQNYYDIAENISFYHWLCHAGKDQLYIDLDGSIYPCKNIKIHLGTIYDYKLLKLKSIICSNKGVCFNEITYRRKLF